MSTQINFNITEIRQLKKQAKNQRADLILLNHQEFQLLFRISAKTSRNWRRKFQIPFVLINSTIYFRLSEILRFIDQQTLLAPVPPVKQGKQ